jgi:hypothetical protein
MLTCVTCNTSGEGDPRDWHQGRHPFRSADDARAGVGWKGPSDARSDEKPDVRPIRTPHDPVLRQALIDKGVLTPQDLRDAEDKIMMISDIFRESMGKPYVHMTERGDDD